MKILTLILGFGFVRWCFQTGAENLSVASGLIVLIGAAVAAAMAVLIFKWLFELLDSPAGLILLLVLLPLGASAQTQNRDWLGSCSLSETASEPHRNFYDVAPYAEYKIIVPGQRSNI